MWQLDNCIILYPILSIEIDNLFSKYNEKTSVLPDALYLSWWLHRESNSGYRRERAVSWPLDHGATNGLLCTTRFNKTGNDLLSQAVPRQVSSALRSLTTVFEMGTGVSSPLLLPDSFFPLWSWITCLNFTLWKPLVKCSTY